MKNKDKQIIKETIEERIIIKSKELYSFKNKSLKKCIEEAIQTDYELVYSQYFSILGIYVDDFVNYIKEKMQNEVK